MTRGSVSTWLNITHHRMPPPPRTRALTPPSNARQQNTTILQNRLAEFSPQWTDVGRVTHYQHCRGQVVKQRTLGPAELGELQALTTDTDQDNVYQVIIVEDMTPDVYYFLQESIWASPDFYNLHLSRSSYFTTPAGPVYHREALSIGDIERCERSFASIRWYRPVGRRTVEPRSEEARDELLRTNHVTKRVSARGRGIETIRKIMTNVFREEISLAASEQEMAEDRGDESAYPAAWEERITIHFSQHPENNKIVTILVDPLLSIQVTSSEIVDSEARPGNTMNLQLHNAPARENPILHRYGNAFEGSEDALKRLQVLQQPPPPASRVTFDDLQSFVDKCLLFNLEPNIVTDLVVMIYSDTIGFLKEVDDLLRKIRIVSAKDHVLQSHLGFWRATLDRIVVELEGGRIEHQTFGKFLAYHKQPALTQQLLRSSTERIGETIQSTEKTYNYLRADVGLLENKRGIAQAESVGKLTELGFIFIPVSCIAGLFSMQVKELQNPVPVRTAIIAAILSVIAAYCVRLSTRSAMVVSWRRKFVARVRSHNGISETSPLTTRSVLRYFFSQDLALALYGKANHTLLVACVCLLGMLPVLMIWTRPQIGSSFKVVVTVIGFLSIVATALVSLSRMSDRWKGPVRKRFKRRVVNNRTFLQRVRRSRHEQDSTSSSSSESSLS